MVGSGNPVPKSVKRHYYRQTVPSNRAVKNSMAFKVTFTVKKTRYFNVEKDNKNSYEQ